MIVVDTNVLSEEMRSTPDPVAHAWFLGQRIANLFTTAVCEAEILIGVERLPRGRRRHALESAAKGVLALFAGRILPFDSAAAAHYSQITTHLKSTGQPIDDFDALIASIVRSRGMQLATRNVRHFSSCGLVIVDPWKI